MIKRTPLSFVYRNQFAQFLRDLTTLLILFVLMIFFSIATLTARLRPLKGITRFADAIGHGEMDAKLSNYAVYQRNDEIGVLQKSIERMLDAINRFTIQAYRLELANRVSQLKIFQAQINPHFLYNTLQCIATSSLEEKDKMYTYHAVTALAQMMRYSMVTSDDMVSFSMECEHVLNYVRLLQMRFGNQTLQTVTNVTPQAMDCLVPRMILQPLVENAFKHGRLMTVPQASLTIAAEVKDDCFSLRVMDNGVGASPQALEEVRAHLASIRQTLGHSELHTFTEYMNELMDTPKPSVLHAKPYGGQPDLLLSDDSIGLGNVYTRLLLHYNGRCSMDIRRSATGETAVEIQIHQPMLWKGRSQ